MTAKNDQSELLREPLLVHAEVCSTDEYSYASSASSNSVSSWTSDKENNNDSSNNSRPAPSNTLGSDTSLASQRQIRGAMWAGGITGLLVGGPIGAGLGVWGGHHFAKKGDGSIGQFVRKTGDFTTRLGASIKREWQEATSDRSMP